MSLTPLMRHFMLEAAHKTGQDFGDFEALHLWSVQSQAQFWELIWAFDGIQSPTEYEVALNEPKMPGARWFEGSCVNYAAHALRHVAAAEAAGQPAIIAEDERGPVATIDWPTLRRRVASLAIELRALGVHRGDRVVAYLPNRPEAVIGFLACASIGAIWAICAPDMGVPAVLERFRQIEPKVLIATDAVHYAGKTHELTGTISQIRDALPNLQNLVLVRSQLTSRDVADTLDFDILSGHDGSNVQAFEPEWLPFDHPLWIVYSSGTTGKPKALVHGHGGTLLATAAMRLHSDLGASYDPRTPGERFHWFSSTGWMMWNTQVSCLLAGTTICIFDGSPMGARDAPDWGLLWRFAARNRVTFFGSGAQFYTMCAKVGLDFKEVGDLSSLRSIGSTASPLPAAVQETLSQRLADAGRPDIWWCNSSGGTDICGSFCSGNRELPPAPGKLQCRQLGAAVEAWDENGKPVIGEVGELVCTRPMPNMPLFLWGDADGLRYHQSYFERWPGVWQHGDWLKIDPDGTCEIFGRSDATINRGGHRMGTSEVYAAIEQLDSVADSLVVDVRVADGDSQLLLFVLPAPGHAVDDIADLLRGAIRSSLSPRFLPDRIIGVSAVPRTLSMKKQELPIKRLFEGAELAKVIDFSAMANAECMPEYVELARQFRSTR